MICLLYDLPSGRIIRKPHTLMNTYAAKPVGDCVFLELDNALQEKLTLESGVEIFLPSWLDQEKYSTCVGRVHSIGDRCKLDIKEGDEVAISYLLVADYERRDDAVIYNRCFNIGNKVVWKAQWVDIDRNEHEIMAVKRDGKWQSVGNWVLLKEIKNEPTFKTTIPNFILPDVATKPADDHGILVSGDVEAPVGSKCYWGGYKRTTLPGSLKSKYQLPDGEEYIFINKDYILGWN